MNRAKITSSRLGEGYAKIDHPSGLTLLLCPMQGFSGAYAIFSTKYGSVDTCFKTASNADYVTVPEGIAHFLEHKLFECEDGDAFSRYAKTGANANAYTSFDRTAYLFSCTQNFEESLEILLDFVTKPYFTPETVQKEQGIIGQEIRMYEDSSEWRVFFNLLGALYHHHPVRLDIAGTTDSIAKIDADLLHRCYRTFYNLHNMVLAVAGNFDIQTVVDVADRILKPTANNSVRSRTPHEPDNVVQSRVEQILPVALPLFQIGFKGKAATTEQDTMLGQVCDEVLLNIIAGESTPLYRRLYDQGLINQTFGGDAMASRDYSLAMFAGESREPDKVYAEILAEITRMQEEGVDPELFSRYKKAAYGRYMGMYGRVDSVASLLTITFFADADLYSPLDCLAALTLDDVTHRLAHSFDVRHSALSIVRGC